MAIAARSRRHRNGRVIRYIRVVIVSDRPRTQSNIAGKLSERKNIDRHSQVQKRTAIRRHARDEAAWEREDERKSKTEERVEKSERSPVDKEKEESDEPREDRGE